MTVKLILVTFDKALKVFQEFDVLLMFDGSAELHQLVGEGVIHAAVGQEVHQMIVQRLERTSRVKSRVHLIVV